MLGLKKRAVLIFMLAELISKTAAGVYRNLGEKECRNIRGQYETCTIRQFCSEDPVKKGCRNCTDIISWCDEDPPLTIRKKYPTCEIECEERKRKRTESELKATGSALREAEGEISELHQKVNKAIAGEDQAKKEVESQSKENQTLWDAVLGLSVVSGVLFIIVILLIVGIVKLWSHKQAAPSLSPRGTASPERPKKSWPRRLLDCFVRKQSSRLAVTADSESPAELALLPRTTEIPPSMIPSCPPDSSGHGSLPTTSSNSLSDAVAPTGGTTHHMDDAKDFMQYSRINDHDGGNGCGGGAAATGVTATTGGGGGGGGETAAKRAA